MGAFKMIEAVYDTIRGDRAGTGLTVKEIKTGGGNTSWNAVHASRSCSQADLVATGGAGLFYCFAT